MAKNPKKPINLEEITSQLLTALDARSKDIITRRYGIKRPEPETLESIGKEYGITRERVRQIQAQAKRALNNREDLLQPVHELYREVFVIHGGILTPDHAVVAVRDSVELEPEGNTVVFYLDLLSPYQYIIRHEHFHPHWQHPETINAMAIKVVEAAQDILRKAGHPLNQQILIDEIRRGLNKNAMELPTEHIYAWLNASQAIEKTPFGDWGSADWAETNPRGVGDKAYAVLRRHGKPEHFTRITELINEARFDHKQANPQTVHNELIKDKRFVLVGRGLYGLGEWGYIPGTVADVIATILSAAKEPMSREDVITKVLEQRQVKKNTIMLGLQNQKRFGRTPENKYSLKQ